METGKSYQITRITGKVLKFKLVSYTEKNRRLELEEFNNRGMLTIDNLSDDELKSIKEIEPEKNI